MTSKEKIAKRIARELPNGALVNLGAGVPLLCARYVPKGVEVYLHAENGIVGAAALAEGEEAPSVYCFDAGGNPVKISPAGAIVDSATAFGLIRGGHLAATVLGVMQVDSEGNLANWTVPGGKLAGMGGAMDLVAGAKRVIAATEHCDRNGRPKIVDKCTFPLTGARVVDMIVTELAVIMVTPEGLLLTEKAPEITVEDLQAKTGAKLIISPDLKDIDI